MEFYGVKLVWKLRCYTTPPLLCNTRSSIQVFILFSEIFPCLQPWIYSAFLNFSSWISISSFQLLNLKSQMSDVQKYVLSVKTSNTLFQCPLSILQNSWSLEILSKLPLFELDSKAALACWLQFWNPHYKQITNLSLIFEFNEI